MIFACPFCHTRVEKTENACHVCHRTMIRRCAYCAEEISVLATICKYCGEHLDPVNVAPPPPRPTPRAERLVVPVEEPPQATPEILEIRDETPKPEVEFVGGMKYCAWEDPTRRCRLSRWWSTWQESQLSPAAFWQRMPTDRGHGRPLSFAWTLTMQMLILALPVIALFGIACGIQEHAPAIAYVAGVAAYIALFPVTFALVAVGTWIKAAFWHVFLKVLGGRGTFEATTRVVAYNTAADAWGMIPVVGGLVGCVMKTVGNYHGFRATHGLSKGRALFASLLPVVVVTALILAVLVALPFACGGPHHHPPTCHARYF